MVFVNLIGEEGVGIMQGDLRYLELNLPDFLARDLEQFKKGLAEHSKYLDCYWGELYGSLNSCRDTDSVTPEQYVYITERYLYGEGK